MTYKQHSRTPRSLDEVGLVSILITIIMMLVISITVLSFAQIIRREQRQALDAQLSSQAFYVAESGINDMRTYIDQHFAGQVPPAKTTCANNAPYEGLNPSIDGTTNNTYTCVLVTGSPQSLSYDLSTSAGSKVFPIDGGGSTISSAKISWTPAAGGSPLVGCLNNAGDPSYDSQPASTAWPCSGYGMIRLDLTALPQDNQANTSVTLNRAALLANTFTAFIMPTKAGAATTTFYGPANINGGTAQQGIRPAAKCNALSCELTITGMDKTRYYARISTIYRDTTVSITAKDATNNALSLFGAQILLDSTGKANDVVRRVQVRVPLVTDGLHGDYGVESTDSMCKQFTTFPSYPNASPC